MATQILWQFSMKNSLIWKFVGYANSHNILNKYQQYLFNISTLVFNNILQYTLESFACGTRFFLGIQVPFSSQVRLSLFVRFLPDLVDWMFSLSSGTFFTTFQTISRRIWRFSRWRNYCLLSCGEVWKVEVSIFCHFQS